MPNWSDTEEKVFIELSTKYNFKDIALMMGRTENAITSKAQALGINIIRSRRQWTEEETDFLMEKWGVLSIECIARKLNKTYAAVLCKKQQLGLAPTTESNENLINISEVCRLLKVEFNTVYYRWTKYGLILIPKRVSNKMTYWYIDPKNLLSFLEANPNSWDSRNLPENILGIEQDWLRRKRLNDYDNPPTKMHFWTTKEIQRATDLYDMGFDNNEIAKKLGITANQVRKKLKSLGIDTNISKRQINQDIDFISENYPDMSIEEIARALNRTTDFVKEKLEAFDLLGYQHKLAQC